MSLQLEFFVEEQSAQIALEILIPKILDGFVYNFEIHPYRGKLDLLGNLPNRLKAYRYIDENTKVFVLIDRDDEDCIKLKAKLEKIAQDIGLSTRSKPHHSGRFDIINRIIVEELEAWFFGDIEAIRAVYPRIPKSLDKKETYRDPDSIKGGTWEQLEKLLKDYYPNGLPKPYVAGQISQHMNPDNNKSKSFQVFRDSLRDLFN